MMRKLFLRGILFTLSSLTFLALPVGGLFTSPVQAQVVDDSWSIPENLSHSGSTTDPQVVVDGRGIIHVGWQDYYYGPRFTQLGEGEWAEPTTPFSSLNMPTTIMTADTSGRIHAIWIDLESENLNMYHSYTLENNFPNGWTPATLIGQWVQDFDFVLGEDSNLHLAYVRSADAVDFPAGVYYRKFDLRTRTWQVRKLLYQSSYLRTVTTENASVEIETQLSGEAQQIYVVWDNRVRKNVYFAKSANGGQDWEEPLMVQASGSENETGKQYGLHVEVSDQDLMLLWQEEATTTTCRQFSQVSSDFGASWQPRQRMLPDFIGCPTENQLVSSGDLIILKTILLNQIHLMAWDSSYWSKPQPQKFLANITDPETDEIVDFQCTQIAVNENNLILVGCDAGAGGDIWLSQMNLETSQKWFSPNLFWSYPTPLAENIEGVNDISLVAEPKGGYHAVWSQYHLNPDISTSSSIYYASTEGENWGESLAVIDGLPGKVKNLTSLIDAQNRLLLFWIGGSSGQVYFSRANASAARSKTEWFKPVTLPAPANGVNSMDVFMNEAGNLSVTYTIPFNENRGVYLTQSTDAGNTWSEPVQVFDGVVKKWDMVTEPHLTGTGSDTLHLMWTQSTLPDGDGPIALYYSRSTDNGKTWAEPQEMVKAAIEWSEIVAIDDRVIHRIWEQRRSDRPTIWFEISEDNGLTWTELNNISNLGMSNGISKLVRDANGSLHLLELVKETNGVRGSMFLQEWFWKGEGWTAGNSVNLGSGNLETSLLAADVTSRGTLSSLVYMLRDDDTSSGEILITGYEVYQDEQTSRLPNKLKSWISSLLFFSVY